MGNKEKKLAVGKAILETYALEKQVANINEAILNNKKLIQDYFDEQNVKMLVAQDRNKEGLKVGPVVVAKKYERVTIKYEPEKLKKKLEPEIFNEITEKTYTINDINEMIKLMKYAGINSSDFKKLINVDIKVNAAEMKRLYEAKEISLKSIEGCYTATISKAIKISDESGDKN